MIETHEQAGSLRILIRGHILRNGVVANRGAEAMFTVASAEIASRLNVTYVTDPEDQAQGVDVIVDISGYCYSDSLRWGAQDLKKAERLKRRNPRAIWVYLPQSFGPFLDVEQRKRYRRLFKEAIMFARGPQSLRHLMELDIGLHVNAATDITWLLKADTTRTDEFLGRLFPVSPPCLLGVGPNLRNERSDKAYRGRVENIAKVLADFGTVMLFPHEFKEGRSDDRTTCRRLRLPYFPEHLSANEIKGLVSRCSLFVGSRYHGLVGAMASAVPSLAIGWTDKYGDLLDEMGFPEFDLSSQSIDEVIATIGSAWQTRNAVSATLRERVELKRRETTDLFDSLCEEIACRVPVEDRFRELRRKVVAGKTVRDVHPARQFGLRRMIHGVEKGLCLQGGAPGRQKLENKHVARLVSSMEAGMNEWEPRTRDWALSVLKQYFERFPDSAEHGRFHTIEQRHLASRHSEIYRASDRPLPPDRRWLERLFTARRSVRQFTSERPAHELIKECVSLALQSPSACNRQAFRLIYIDSPEKVDAVVSIPLGARDIRVPGLFVIIGCYEGYSEVRDVKCPIIDASLAAMSLMLALESSGLSSLPINFPEAATFSDAIRKACDLKSTEIVVMLLGVGVAAEDAFVAFSAKRPVDDVLTLNSIPPGEVAEAMLDDN